MLPASPPRSRQLRLLAAQPSRRQCPLWTQPVSTRTGEVQSYEARVFLNNPAATLETPLEPGEGYAGSFNVFGHGACYGEEGHCDPERTATPATRAHRTRSSR